MKRWLAMAVAPLSLALLSTSASASHWYSFFTVSDGEWLFDFDSVQLQGETVNVWLKYRHKAVDAHGKIEETERWSFDCYNKRAQLTSYADYNAAGTLLQGGNLPEPREWLFIAPDTMGEAFTNVACGKPAPSSK